MTFLLNVSMEPHCAAPGNFLEFIKRANYPEKQSGLVISMYVWSISFW